MTQQEKSTAGISKRIGLPTPEFFKSLRLWCSLMGSIFTGSVIIWSVVAPSTVINILIAVGATFTLISTSIATLPVDWGKVEAEQKEQ